MLDMHRVGNETISMLKLKPCLESHRRGGRCARGEEERINYIDWRTRDRSTDGGRARRSRIRREERQRERK